MFAIQCITLYHTLPKNVKLLNYNVLLNIAEGKVYVEKMSTSLDFYGPPLGCQAVLKGVWLDIKWLLIKENDTVSGHPTTSQSSYLDYLLHQSYEPHDN